MLQNQIDDKRAIGVKLCERLRAEITKLGFADDGGCSLTPRYLVPTRCVGIHSDRAAVYNAARCHCITTQRVGTRRINASMHINNPQRVYQLLLDHANNDSLVEAVNIGVVWTVCKAGQCGLAMSPQSPTRNSLILVLIIWQVSAELFTDTQIRYIGFKYHPHRFAC